MRKRSIINQSSNQTNADITPQRQSLVNRVSAIEAIIGVTGTVIGSHRWTISTSTTATDKTIFPGQYQFTEIGWRGDR